MFCTIDEVNSLDTLGRQLYIVNIKVSLHTVALFISNYHDKSCFPDTSPMYKQKASMCVCAGIREKEREELHLGCLGS